MSIKSFGILPNRLLINLLINFGDKFEEAIKIKLQKYVKKKKRRK